MGSAKRVRLVAYVAVVAAEFTSMYVVDVLWCQPIKLIHVVSTSEFHEYWWNDVDFIFFVPSI